MPNAASALAGVVALTLSCGDAHAGCRLALALGIDVSASVNTREYALQMKGTAAALRAPAVRDALLQGEPVAMAAYLWSGRREHWLVADWSLIDGDAALDRLAATIGAMARPPFDGRTATGEAMRAGLGLMRQAPDCVRRTIDLATEGEANDGVPPAEVQADGVTINALTIGGDDVTDHADLGKPLRALSAWAAENILRGADAFAERARDHEDFERAMTRKLLRELGEMMVGQGAHERSDG